MARREYRNTFKCAEGGCREVSFHVSERREDERALLLRQRDKPFRCSRHEDPARNLRPGNEATRHVLIASRIRACSRRLDEDEPRYLDGLFWLREGQERGGSGYSYGPGFNAHASDFPEGTRLVIETHVEIPAERAEEPAA